jgi:hypothetical protein
LTDFGYLVGAHPRTIKKLGEALSIDPAELLPDD